MSQIQGMRPEPPHRSGGQGVNPAASLLPTDGGSVGDGYTGHAEGCARDRPEVAETDIFCECHAFEAPRILASGTIAWPEGWDAAKAEEWRRQNGLVPPSEPGSGP